MESRWVFDIGEQKVSGELRWVRKFFLSANRKSANSWTLSAVANPHIFEVCQYANLKSAHLQGKSSISDLDPHCIFHTTKCQKSSLNLNESSYICKEKIMYLRKSLSPQKIIGCANRKLQILKYPWCPSTQIANPQICKGKAVFLI